MGGGELGVVGDIPPRLVDADFDKVSVDISLIGIRLGKLGRSLTVNSLAALCVIAAVLDNPCRTRPWPRCSLLSAAVGNCRDNRTLASSLRPMPVVILPVLLLPVDKSPLVKYPS